MKANATAEPYIVSHFESREVEKTERRAYAVRTMRKGMLRDVALRI
jgi:hypothetical protein